MRNYGIYIAKRFGLFVLVVFVGISLTFLITHLTPIDPVEQMIASMTAFGDTSPEAVEMMRPALRELYGVEGNLFEQYLNYWRRMLVLDFGPSLSAFPTPVSVLIARALPWTIGLLVTCTLISWSLGNSAGRPVRVLPRQPRRWEHWGSSRWRSTRSPTTSSPSSFS